MKLFKTFSTLSVALLATFANANTTEVVTAELVKVQPVQAIEVMNTVELDLALSMQEIKVNLTSLRLANHEDVVSTNEVNDKQLTAKLAVVAE